MKIENPKNQDIRLQNIKILRKNRSHPRFKTKLNKEIFIKKLNEYINNNKINNNFSYYISQLNHLKETKSEDLYNKTMVNFTLKDFINKINKENRNINNNKKKNNVYQKKKKKESMTQYYEEEINKNTLQHVPRSISNMIIKKNIIEDFLI